MTEKDPHVTKQLSKNPLFEVGDVVRLISGGPSMIIREIDGDKVFCEWFDKATPRSHTFLKLQLSHTNPEQLPVIGIHQYSSDGANPPWEYLEKKAEE